MHVRSSLGGRRAKTDIEVRLDDDSRWGAETIRRICGKRDNEEHRETHRPSTIASRSRGLIRSESEHDGTS